MTLSLNDIIMFWTVQKTYLLWKCYPNFFGVSHHMQQEIAKFSCRRDMHTTITIARNNRQILQKTCFCRRNVFKDMCRMGQKSLCPWFDENQPIFDEDMHVLYVPSNNLEL